MTERPGDPGAAAGPGPLRHHRLFGFAIESDFAFARPLPTATGEPDLRFTRATRPLLADDPGELAPVFRSPLKRAGRSVSSLYRLDGREILRFEGTLDFELGQRRIEYLAPGADLDWLVELRFLGPVMSYWMERRGLLCLHASTVAVGDRAAVLVAAGGGGKTTLAAALLGAGHELLGDDIAAIEDGGGGFLVRPGYPEMRMWPDTARRWLDCWRELPLAHPGMDKLRVPLGPAGLGGFRDELLPVGGIYLLERRESAGPPELQPAAARPAVIELITRSFSPHLVEAAGLQPERLDRLGRLVEAVPVRRLRYPAGQHRLASVAAVVSRDVAGAAA